MSQHPDDEFGEAEAGAEGVGKAQRGPRSRARENVATKTR